MTEFRVHYEIGEPITVPAATPAEARKTALARHLGIITKVKIVRETAEAN